VGGAESALLSFAVDGRQTPLDAAAPSCCWCCCCCCCCCSCCEVRASFGDDDATAGRSLSLYVVEVGGAATDDDGKGARLQSRNTASLGARAAPSSSSSSSSPRWVSAGSAGPARRHLAPAVGPSQIHFSGGHADLSYEACERSSGRLLIQLKTEWSLPPFGRLGLFFSGRCRRCALPPRGRERASAGLERRGGCV
jgi:hypothetical protein